MTKEPKIIHRGRGPEIEGTRITVYHVLEYLRAGRSRDYIASVLQLSSAQIQCAIDYINEHQKQVNAEYDEIQKRIAQGNPEWVEERLKQNRPRFEELLAASREKARGANSHAENHVG